MSTATELGTDVLAGLDFDVTVPCEHGNHQRLHVPDDPAAWVVWTMCPGCGHRLTYLLCDSGRELNLNSEHAFECHNDACDYIDVWSAFVIATIPLAEVTR